MLNTQTAQIKNLNIPDRTAAECIICQQPKNDYITIFGKSICNQCQNSFSQNDMEDYRRKARIIKELIVCR